MTVERWVALVVGALNVAAGAALAGWPGDWPAEPKLAVVVVQAIAVFVLAQVKSWEDAAPVVPHG